jgi:hypothetical protein
MPAYLVRARITDLGPSPEGSMTLYVAIFDTEAEALEAVRAKVPSSWKVEEVDGIAASSYVERHRLRKGDVQPF